MGVSGFLISCATCCAISRQAFSFSLRANSDLLNSSLSTRVLYAFTITPISSLPFQTIFLFSRNDVRRNISVIHRNGLLSQRAAITERNKNIINTKVKVIRTRTNTDFLVFSKELCDSKKGMLKTPVVLPVAADFN